MYAPWLVNKKVSLGGESESDQNGTSGLTVRGPCSCWVPWQQQRMSRAAPSAGAHTCPASTMHFQILTDEAPLSPCTVNRCDG